MTCSARSGVGQQLVGQARVGIGVAAARPRAGDPGGS
jgi:hypothetical protein